MGHVILAAAPYGAGEGEPKGAKGQWQKETSDVAACMSSSQPLVVLKPSDSRIDAVPSSTWACRTSNCARNKINPIASLAMIINRGRLAKKTTNFSN